MGHSVMPRAGGRGDHHPLTGLSRQWDLIKIHLGQLDPSRWDSPPPHPLKGVTLSRKRNGCQMIGLSEHLQRRQFSLRPALLGFSVLFAHYRLCWLLEAAAGDSLSPPSGLPLVDEFFCELVLVQWDTILKESKRLTSLETLHKLKVKLFVLHWKMSIFFCSQLSVERCNL